MEAASAVESHRRQPDFVPVGALTIGGGMFLPLRRSDQFIITQDLQGGLYVGVVRREKGGLRLSQLLVGQQSAWLK